MKHSFQDSLNPFCNYGLDMSYIIERRTLQSTIENVNNLLDLSEPVLIKTLLFGSNSFDTKANTNVLNVTIEYIISTKRFDKPLFQ